MARDSMEAFFSSTEEVQRHKIDRRQTFKLQIPSFHFDDIRVFT